VGACVVDPVAAFKADLNRRFPGGVVSVRPLYTRDAGP
jgi:hypothetical protein